MALTALGRTITPNWTDPELLPKFDITKPNEDGIYEFDFIAEPPDGETVQKITDLERPGEFQWEMPGNLKQVIVYTNSNKAFYPGADPSVTTEKFSTDVIEATGYSTKSFEEAFNNAALNIPLPPKSDFKTVLVDHIGATIGGIAQTTTYFVKVKRVR